LGASLQAEQKNFRVPLLAWIQLLRVSALVKRLDLFYNSESPLALKNKPKKNSSESLPIHFFGLKLKVAAITHKNLIINK